MRKRLALTLSCFLFFCMESQAQKGTVKGILKDSAIDEVLALASVTVFTAKDTSVIAYRLSDPAGVFRVPGIPHNILCRIIITFQGYRVYRQEFMLTKEKPEIDFGTLFMTDDPGAMNEILLIAERPPVSMHNDTLEFNASAFKTLPSALVEDLLKKLPGVDVDLDSNITVNGRKVNRLLVDGKQFFGGDQKIATRNLPANMVDKVQVVDDREEARRNPLLTKEEVGQVVNIKLIKSIKQGGFGKVNAGSGTNRRHEAGGIVNFFRDTIQVSFLGYSNNVNKPGFTSSDLTNAGGFDRGGNESFINSRSGPGLQQSAGGGTNFNTMYGSKVTVNLEYFYGQIKSDFYQTSFHQQFLKDTILSSPAISTWQNANRQHRIGARLQWEIDSLTSLFFNPGVTIRNDRSTSTSTSSTADNFRGFINQNSSQSHSDGKSYNHNYSLNFNKGSAKKEGRSLDVSSTVLINNQDNNNYNDGHYTFYRYGIGNDSLIDQLQERIYGTTQGSLIFNYTEPLSKMVRLVVSHNAVFEKQSSSLGFFNRDSSNGKYALFNEALSTSVQTKAWRNTATANVSYRYKELTFSPGISFYSFNSKSSFTKDPNIIQRYFYVYPSLTLYWKGLNLGYRVNVSEPEANALQRVIDISSPLYKRFGNPDLKPSYQRSVNVGYAHYSQKNQSSISCSLNGSFINDATIFETILDSNRVQISRPINIDGNKSYSGQANYNRQFKFTDKLRMSLRPGFEGSYYKNVLIINGVNSKAAYVRAAFNFSVLLNYNDKIEWNQRYILTMNNSHFNNTTAYRNTDVVTHGSQSEVVVRWPAHFVWETQAEYTFNPQVSPGIHKAILHWNGSINYAFGKEDKTQIKLSAYDLLNQNVSVIRYTSESGVSDTQTATLHRYLLLSFVYNIRNFSGGKAGNKDRAFDLW